MFRVETNYPIAIDSPDHLHPKGTACDNNTWPGFIDDVEKHFARKVRFLDLGCAGGQFVADFLARGHEAVGLEGSDYSLRHNRANWPTLAGANLFTCDISRPFRISIGNDGWPGFDVITAIEVLEHIPPDRIDQVLKNIADHLHPNGWFVASIGTRRDTFDGVELHQTVEQADWWQDKLSGLFSPVLPCPINSWPRHKHKHSLSVCVSRKL